MEFSISTTPRPERYTIAVTGEIDISNADKLRNAIDLALEQPTERVELDFTDVAYIDSTGIGVLVGAAHHADEHGKGFAVVNAQAPVMRVAKLLGVDKDLSISASHRVKLVRARPPSCIDARMRVILTRLLIYLERAHLARRADY